MEASQLQALVAHGDRRTAAALLVRQFAPAVFALCRAMVRDPELAEDLSQDVFARAFAALAQFRGEASPRTWLLKIARNRCLDHLERTSNAPLVADEPDTYAGDDTAPIDMLASREDAERALAVLGESERALVVLHFGHGVGYGELSEAFALGQGAVRMRVSRALARMRAALATDDMERATGRMSVPRFDLDTVEETGLDTIAEAALDTEASAAIPAFDDNTIDDADFEQDTATTMRIEPPAIAALRDDVPVALWDRLDALASRV